MNKAQVSGAPKTKVAKKDVIKLPIVDIDGKAQGEVEVPKELFGTKINKKLLAQAIRVYEVNQRVGQAATKTRGEVEGSTRKIYRQKGTGRARHGSIRAPIFVGGGIVFGPSVREFNLKLTKKMRKLAFASALTSKRETGDILAVQGLDSLEPKTKAYAKMFQRLNGEMQTLFIVPKRSSDMIRASRNIAHIDVLPPTSVNTYEILKHKKVVFAKDALDELIQTYQKQKS